jgi:hypothetical protein
VTSRSKQKLLPTDVDDCCICCGTGKKSHLFLEAESFCCCFTCGKIICMQCIFNKENTEEIYCYECFLPEISVDISQVDSIMTSHQLREELDKMNIITPADDDRFILQEMYDAMINSSLYESVTDRISVPKENSLYLQELENNSKISSFNVSEGGHMIINESINPVQIIKLIKMMALLVKMYDKEKDGTIRNKEYMQNTYKLVPSSIVRFAEDSRVKGGGGHLVDRCIRHSTDQETPDLMEATGHVVEYQDEPRLLLNHIVRSSMKQDEYKVSVCFSEETIVSCSCDCRVGSIGTGRVLCVHVLPVIYQMTLLLFDGLADNLLITIANNWDRLAQGVDSTNMKEIKEHILLLKSAATRQMNPNDDSLDLDVILEQYLVGTEKRKFGRRRLRKHKKELGPIRRLCFASCNQHAKRMMDDVEKQNNIVRLQEEQEEQERIESEAEPNLLSTEDYINICKFIAAFQRRAAQKDKCKFLSEYIGYQLLFKRANNFDINNPGNIRQYMNKVSELISLANGNIKEKRTKLLSTNTIDTADTTVLSDDDNSISSIPETDYLNNIQIKLEDESDSDKEQQEEPTLICEEPVPKKKIFLLCL